ncbi:cytochrome c oxidase subunit 3 [Lyngbya confervoides]|uniref:Oxidase aa(3) subunit 3 n=1 Tax=Lyngbya confervoides BDU141951 TaxID=1574623 RepID=A0ABD4T417_9CYAN|nr:heme-copper oxidase subunit III [Lyngbya confervoides]MCM1983556.1 heme-copper oxidase subunit III [Lyngbya confervoides BDU141951]
MQGSTVNPNAPSINVADADAMAHGHGEHPDLRLFGFILFLISESMLFVGLFVAYGAFRVVSESWPPVGTPELERLLPGINTVILLSSSFVIHRADVAIKQGDLREARRWFIYTMLMGATFLAGQAYEYQHLEFGLTSHLFGSTFFILTGFHGLHVFVGLLMMGAVLWRSRRPGHYSAEQHFGIEATEIYWHFVDVIWIILFTLLYIL